MRAVDKGLNTTTYTKYEDALKDLTDQMGHYCSYCEMGVNNMIEVEHIHPVKNGGNELEWENFLLACKYCNTIKSNNNEGRNGYLWPDIDNTDLLFDYTIDENVLIVKATLDSGIKIQAEALIKLVELSRYPGTINRPTKKDKRWILRNEAITTAMSSYNRWLKIKDDDTTSYRKLMAEQIAETSLVGFYSIWYKIFENEQIVLNEIDLIWKTRYNNFKEFMTGTTLRIIRKYGQI